MFRCTVDAADGPGARLRGPQGIGIATKPPGLPAAGTVHVAIRRDRMRIDRVAHHLRAVGAPDAAGGETWLTSQVAAVEYHGNQVKLRLEADGIDDLTVMLTDKEFYADRVAAGDTVAVAWNDDDAHVMD